jgi:GWxTD domain-containing protein
MLRWWVFGIACLAGLRLEAAGLQLRCLNVPTEAGTYQTQVWVAVGAEALTFRENQGTCSAEVLLRVVFRLADGRTPVKSERRYTLALADDRWPEAQQLVLTRELPVPAGAYDVWAELIDLATGQGLLTQERYQAYRTPELGTFFMGDVQLQLASGAPLIAANLPGDSTVLRFRLDYFQPSGKPFTLRAILHRQERAESEDDARRYVSVQQQTQALYPKASLGEVLGSFSMEGLPPGPYLLELLALDDEQLLGATSTEFLLEWRGRRALEARPDSFLRLMSPLAEGSWLQRALAQGDSRRQQAALLDYWVQHREDPEDYPTRALESYFLQVETATKRYGLSPEGVPSTRAQAQVRLGLPDRIRRTGAKEIWEYDSYLLQLEFPAATSS